LIDKSSLFFALEGGKAKNGGRLGLVISFVEKRFTYLWGSFRQVLALAVYIL
jgi:hypothetical protein